MGKYAESRKRGLKPWPKGVSGNPGGRPKKRPITDRYYQKAEEPLSEKDCKRLELPIGATWGDLLALRQFQAADKGSTNAAREIREAIEGKAPQRFEITGPERKEITIRVVRS